jgi:hypothetical protein
VAAFAPVAAVRDYAMPTRTVNRSLALRHHIAPPLDEILLSCAAYDGDAGIISSGEDCPSSESARDRAHVQGLPVGGLAHSSAHVDIAVFIDHGRYGGKLHWAQFTAVAPRHRSAGA